MLLRLTLALTLITATSCRLKDKPAMLMVGDSWAQLMCAFGSFESVLKERFKDKRAECLGTTKAGTWAKDWAKPGELKTAKSFLIANPNVKAVYASLGGNDLLGSWNVQMSPAESDQALEVIKNNISSVIEELLATRDDVQIVIAGYDFPNFDLLMPGRALESYRDLYTEMGEPSPRELNAVIVELSHKMREIAESFERVHFVPTLGLNQHLLGHPDHGIAPRELPAPAQDLIAGGDPYITQPRSALLNIKNTPLVDPYHLNPTAFKNYARHIMDNKLADIIETQAQ